jgi:hypothetical protein
MMGTLRRHTFAPHELDLLLDLSTCGVRKSARTGLLRRYLSHLKAMQRTQGDAVPPPRLSLFLQSTGRKPPTMQRATSSTKKAAAGLSSK